MTRNFIRSATFAALMLLGASMAGAQEFANLGELLDKGGKRLDAAELKALLTGATTSGTLLGGKFDAETTYASDGKMSGRFWGGNFPPFYRGTWSVNEQGQLCFDGMADERSIGHFRSCNPWYSLNNVYYMAASVDRSAVVRTRKIKR